MKNGNCVLSNVTRRYLDKFYDILYGMIAGMTDADLSDSISHNFISQMIPHHLAAIEMSENILNYTTLVPLRNIAEGIITEQTQSIEDMLAIDASCSELINSPKDLKRYRDFVNETMRTMFFEMGNACSDNNISADFMREMIPHHEGAIKMSHNALRYDICPQLRPVLYAIIKSQEKGVRQMECLLRRCFC